MKFAPIVPPQGLRVLERVGIGYHFVLGQELLRNREYRRYYAALGRLGHFIIVDNGAAERDTPEFKKIVHLANGIGASEIVLPDVLTDAEATLELITDDVLKLVPPRRRMIVPQGTNEEEWFICLDALLRRCSYSIETIGIPKHMEPRVPGGRAALLARMALEYGPLIGHRHIHLLGVYNDPFREISAASAICDVRGIDSGMPVAWAQRYRTLSPEADIPPPDVRISLAWDAPFELDLAKNNIWEVARYAAEYPS